MEVHGIGSVQGAYPVRPAQPSGEARPGATAKPVSPQDEVEISSAGKLMEQLNNSSEVRQERLALIKQAIDDGTYDTDEKLEAALSRMLAEIGDRADD